MSASAEREAEVVGSCNMGTDSTGTSLLAAARAGLANEVARLLTGGELLSPDVVDDFGNSALYYACHYGHSAVVALLVQHGLRDDSTRRCWRNALDRAGLPRELQQRVPDAASVTGSVRGARPASEVRQGRRERQAAALASEIGVDISVARAMLYGATRLRHRGTAHKMVCSPRRWSGTAEIDAFFAPLLAREGAEPGRPGPRLGSARPGSEPELEPEAEPEPGGVVAVRALDMRKCLMSGHGAACLSTVISHPSCGLLDLYLFANALQNEGARILSEGLRQNTSLTKLNLCGNEIGPAGAAALGCALSAHPSLTQCDLNCNEITDAGVVPLVAHIGAPGGTSSPLAVLSLRKNGLSDAAIDVLYRAAVANPRLADIAVCTASWGKTQPRRQKRLQASSGLGDTISAEAASKLNSFLEPRRLILKAAKDMVDDPVALRKLFTAAGEEDDGQVSNPEIASLSA